MSQFSVYVYFDHTGDRRYTDETDFNFVGTWSAFGSYVAGRDVITYSDTRYIAIIDNIGANPQAQVTKSKPAKWSTLAKIVEGTGTSAQDALNTVATSGSAVAVAAWELAQIGTNAASSAYEIGSSAYLLAQIGTNTGTAAYDLAVQALTLAQIGTASGERGLNREVPNLAARDALLPEIRHEGMYVWVQDAAKGYHLLGGITNAHWATDDAERISFVHSNHPTFQNVEDALNHLLYVAPGISAFNNNVGTVMIGTTVSSVGLSWSYNKPMTSASLNQGIGSIDSDLTVYTHVSSFGTDRTYTLTSGDSVNTVNANTSVLFRNPRFWGASANASLDNAGVQALSTELASSRNQTRTIVASGQYVYFAWPVSFGTPNFTVNGLPNTAWTQSILSFTNLQGHTADFYVYRSDNILTGSYTIAVS